MSIEFWCLYAAMGLALVHLTAASFTFKAQVGNRYSVGPRDEDLRPTGVAGRLERAQRNFLETFAVFVAAVMMLTILREEGAWSAVGAVVYVAGRVVFLPLYAWGVPWLRTFSWNFATLGARPRDGGRRGLKPSRAASPPRIWRPPADRPPTASWMIQPGTGSTTCRRRRTYDDHAVAGARSAQVYDAVNAR